MELTIAIPIIALLLAMLAYVLRRHSYLRSEINRESDCLEKLAVEYRTKTRVSVKELWNYFRLVCNEDEKILIESVNNNSEISEHAADVCDFYARLAHFLDTKEITKDNLLKYWDEKDISILEKIVIPIRSTVYFELHGKKPDFKNIKSIIELSIRAREKK